MKLFRAANDCNTNPDTTAFAVRKSDARKYMDNPGFGGARLYAIEVDVDPATVLDATEETPTWLEALLPGARDCLGSAISMRPRVADAIAERGYKWVRLVDSFPEDCVTMLLIGSDSDIEEAMLASEVA